MAANGYQDPALTVDESGVTIRRYYFPTGSAKRVPFPAIRSVSELELGALRNKYRMWGTSDFSSWLNYDSGRRKKERGFELDVGKRIRPVVTPDDPEAFREALAARGVEVRPS